MAPQLYLITPAAVDPESFPATLMAVLNAAEFAALLVCKGSHDDATYAKLAANMINIGQGAGCAVLIEDDIALARRIGADGVHITGGPEAIASAVKALKPAMIVGAGNLHSRHDAMTAGEMDIDYVFFGPLTGAHDADAVELAQWWAETFEIPAVLSLPEASAETADAEGAEFMALSQSLWSSPTPAATMTAIAAKLEVSA